MPQMAKRPENAPEIEAASLARRKAIFESEVLMHLNSAFTLARYLTRRGDVAEDLVQEALLRAYRSFDETRSSNVRAWLLTIVRNCFLTWKVRTATSPRLAISAEPARRLSKMAAKPRKMKLLSQF